MPMKRARSASPTSGGTHAHAGTTSPEHNAKFQRIETPTLSPGTNQLIWCSLAPTCSPPNEPSSFHSLEELEKHYAQCHAYVCNAEGCNCVFERDYYLNLHQTELHDPLVQIKKERGEPIYRCLLPDCEVLSQTPNQRRRHLIADHQFDERFFFSVIKFGIGDQIRAWASRQQQQQPAVQEQEQSSQSTPLQSPLGKPSGQGKKKNRESMRITSTSTVASSDGFHSTSTSISIDTPPSTAHSMSIWNAEPKHELDNLALKLSKTTLLASSFKHGPPVTKIEIQEDFNKKRNTSLVDLKLLTEDRDTSPEDDDEMDDDSPQTGVRFADKVAIRLLSPIDRRYGDGRKSRRRSTGRRGGRPGGVHSDDETNVRSKNFREVKHSSRGKGRGRRPPSTDKTQQPSN